MIAKTKGQEAKITVSAPIRLEQAQPVPPRAIGVASLRVGADDRGQTGFQDIRTSGAFKLVFPRCRAGVEAVVINTAGGVTGGDSFQLDASAATGGHLTLTTQAAERAYRALPGQVGHVTARLSVAAGASLFWLPQELILFEGSALSRRLEVDMDGDARLLMVEPVVLGRAAMQEHLTDIRFRDRITVRRDGAPLYLDGLDLTGDAAAHITRRATGNGALAFASLLFVAPEAEQHLSPLRALLPPTAGASLLAPDTLALRLVAADGFELRRTLLPVLDRLTGGTLPRSWRL